MTAGPGTDLPTRLAALVAQARSLGSPTPVLVSVSEAVPMLDPLDALRAAAHAAWDDDAIAGMLDAGRMFWAHPRDGIALAGLGAAATLSPAGDDRFVAADAEWRALLDGALGDGPGTGPILMGGFSFEPDGPRSDLWHAFPSTLLVVPALHVAVSGGACWLTVSTVIGPDGSASVEVDDVLRLREVVLAGVDGDGEPLPDARHDDAPLSFVDVLPETDWRALVDDAVDAIRRGALEKVVLARAVHADLPGLVDDMRLLDHLRAAHRDGYVFGCWRGDQLFAGASPERLVRLSGGMVDASSLAGSIRRGDTAEEDAALAGELMGSAKDLAEHALVRSALHEALGALCDDVTFSDAPSLLSLPNVHHLHTAVRARLREGHSLLELVGALHPTPAVGGTPRTAALHFIIDHEQLDRGWYAAPIGWIGRDAGELAVALRSAVISDDTATLFAGCGIVAESEAGKELAESQVKLRAMELALAATLDPAHDEPATAAAPGRHG